MIKAAEGGGGKGMRVVHRQEELVPLFRMARAEAEQAFGSGDVYLEKFIERPRHIEFQVLADQYGEVMHLGERECSIQRRHQKLVEEAPSAAVDTELRRQMGSAVVATLRSLGYTNAGTVEFLMDEKGNFYFIEMNTRIQVEHCVTEMVTGIDLVKAQIQLAAAEPMRSISRPDLHLRGHAIECRIVAEDPESFNPSSGRITAFHTPGGTGVRVDTAAYAEAIIPPYYDSLIAKLITHGKDRGEAVGRMGRALEMFIIEGIQTSVPVLRKIVADPDFQAGRYDTHFMSRFLRNHLA
jgi:acetyl-CoA carboxylase biotin carboxylase subunit